jgi:hypothetical protein
MQAIVVDHDTKEVKDWVAAYGRQVPFAGSIAINRTGEEALEESRNVMRRTFTIRTYQGREFLPDAKLIGSRRATKQRLYAFVGIGNPQAGPKTFYGRLHRIYARQEFSTGAAQAGINDFFIPADRVDSPSYQPPRKEYPTSLGLAVRRGIDGSWTSAKSRTSKRGRGGYFILPHVNGDRKGYGIYHRDTGSRGKGTRGDISAVWFLRPSIKRRPRPFFIATMQKVVDSRFATNLLGALQAAVRTARPK